MTLTTLQEARKPDYGSPCNGCGLCCRVRPCDLARDLCGVIEAPCPVIVEQGGIARCGLVLEPHKFVIGMAGKPWTDAVLSPLFSEALGIGTYCDSEAVE